MGVLQVIEHNAVFCAKTLGGVLLVNDFQHVKEHCMQGDGCGHQGCGVPNPLKKIIISLEWVHGRMIHARFESSIESIFGFESWFESFRVAAG